MIPTPGKMTPSATLLMKSPLHSDGPHIGSPSLLSCSGAGGGMGREGRGGAGAGRHQRPALRGGQGRRSRGPCPGTSFPQPTL